MMGKAVRAALVMALLTAVLYRAFLFYSQAFTGFAWDFAVNVTAAQALLDNVLLYDRQALHELAKTVVSHQNAGALFRGAFTSFVGLPTTAMLYVPFTTIPFESSVQCYRMLALLGMLLAIFFTGVSLPKHQRCAAWCAGVFCLLWWNAFPFSLRLGQVDAWVMLSCALTVLAISRERWIYAGVAVSVAILLKVSPVWLLLYCLFKRQWMVLVSASVCLVVWVLVSALPLRGDDFWQFVSAVLPTLGDSPVHVQNQSLGAGMARLFAQPASLLSFAEGMGGWKWFAVVVVMLLLWWRHRHENSVIPTASGAALAVACALLAGPLTWDHYLSWAVIPVMLLFAQLTWRWRTVLFVILLPLVFAVPYPNAAMVVAHFGWRILTMAQIFSVLMVAVLLTQAPLIISNRIIRENQC